MRQPAAFRAAAVLLWCCSAGLWSPWPPVAADPVAAVRTGEGGVRWRSKHKGGGGGGGTRTSHRWHGDQPEMALNVGMLVPKTSFGVRGYLRAINDAMREINKANKRNHSMTYSKLYDFEAQNVRYRMMSLTPSPTGRYA